jgi:hypothetical protein
MMILPLHIIIALSSLIHTGYIFMRPTASGLQVSYVLVILTLFSGFGLVLSKPANMTQTCVTGLVYLGVVSFGIASARYKLAKQKI